MDFFTAIFELLDRIKDSKIARVLFIIAIICACFKVYDFWYKSDFFIEHFRKPVWNYSVEQGYDIIEADIELKTGKTVVTPQIQVKYDDKVVFIIDVLLYYELNQVYLSENADGKVQQFRLEVEDIQREKFNHLCDALKTIIVEKVSDKDFYKGAQLEFFEVKVVEINSQNLKAGKTREQYMFISDFAEFDIGVWEAQTRRTIYHINLENYEPEGNIYENEEVMEIIDACVNKILGIN